MVLDSAYLIWVSTGLNLIFSILSFQIQALPKVDPVELFQKFLAG